MRRRQFIALLGGVSAGLVWPLRANAQKSNVRRIGVLVVGNADADAVTFQTRLGVLVNPANPSTDWRPPRRCNTASCSTFLLRFGRNRPDRRTTKDTQKRVALRDRIRANLPIERDGTIHLIARAWAVRGTVQ